jgi:hypothetical protein
VVIESLCGLFAVWGKEFVCEGGEEVMVKCGEWCGKAMR